MSLPLLNPPVTFPKRASIQTLGCRLNQYESKVIRDRLEEAGYRIVPFESQADLAVINTCTVTNVADAKSRNAIRRFTRSNPQAVTVVVGCYSQVGYKAIAEIPGIDYVIGNNDKLNLLEYVGEGKTDQPIIIRERMDREDFSITFVGDAPFQQRANLKLQDGCDFMCSFCIIPFARGRARSRDFDNLIKEAESLASRGVREFVLTGVNLGVYENSGKCITEAIDALAAIQGVDRIRISSIEPTTIPEDLFWRMASPEHPLLPFLHVPFQSGCDRTLKAMRRLYEVREALEFIQRAVEQVPGLCVGTDLMVGFPGETEADFDETCRFFLERPFAYCHVFPFSERHGTPAVRMSNQVAVAERKRRSAHLRRLSAAKRFAFDEAQVGKTANVLFEDCRDDLFPGYTENFVRVAVPCQDGLDLTNRLGKVRLIRPAADYLEAEFIEILS
ncbi:MAG: tRNA (N(6)-L-threonylcarbamoyladenosine(37)-C(2))-methylthiotransferase MtaB [Opitutae bacterium]|nr:tRNA (N(6)-L-threonylcarbamoyladenosine(37)-C(2))-methylthiotransferase MtaB [Opitutae bacterium]